MRERFKIEIHKREVHDEHYNNRETEVRSERARIIGDKFFLRLRDRDVRCVKTTYRNFA